MKLDILKYLENQYMFQNFQSLIRFCPSFVVNNEMIKSVISSFEEGNLSQKITTIGNCTEYHYNLPETIFSFYYYKEKLIQFCFQKNTRVNKYSFNQHSEMKVKFLNHNISKVTIIDSHNKEEAYYEGENFLFQRKWLWTRYRNWALTSKTYNNGSEIYTKEIATKAGLCKYNIKGLDIVSTQTKENLKTQQFDRRFNDGYRYARRMGKY